MNKKEIIIKTLKDGSNKPITLTQLKQTLDDESVDEDSLRQSLKELAEERKVYSLLTSTYSYRAPHNNLAH